MKENLEACQQTKKEKNGKIDSKISMQYPADSTVYCLDMPLNGYAEKYKYPPKQIIKDFGIIKTLTQVAFAPGRKTGMIVIKTHYCHCSEDG